MGGGGSEQGFKGDFQGEGFGRRMGNHFTGDEEMRGRGRVMVKGERWREGSVEKQG